MSTEPCSWSGVGLHFPQIDEDISVDDLLRGGPAPRHSHLIRTGFEKAPSHAD